MWRASPLLLWPPTWQEAREEEHGSPPEGSGVPESSGAPSPQLLCSLSKEPGARWNPTPCWTSRAGPHPDWDRVGQAA